MKKKFISLLLAVCMCLSVGALLTACNEEHSHTYKTEWTYDTTHHWHECEGYDCSDVSDKAEHLFTDGVCVCGYEQVASHTCVFKTEWTSDTTHHWHICEENTCAEVSQKEKHTLEDDVCSVCGYELPASALASNAVTEEQFYKAVSFADVTSVTVNGVATNVVVGDPVDGVYYSNLWIDGNKFKEKMCKGNESKIEYYELFDTYTYVFSQDKTNGWQREKVSYVLDGIGEILGLDDEDWNFDEWSYADGVYTMVEETTEDIIVTATLVFWGDRLHCFKLEAEIDGTLQYQEMTFSDYNCTTVELPTDYVDYIAQPEPLPLSKEEWESIFTPEQFKNVTISAEEGLLTYDIVDETESGTMIQGTMHSLLSTWILIDSGNKIIQWNGEDGVNQEIYYDGENWFYYDTDGEPLQLILLPTNDERYEYVIAWERYFDMIELSYDIYDELEFDKLNDRYLYSDGKATYSWSFLADDLIVFYITIPNEDGDRVFNFSFQRMGSTEVILPECEKVM